MNPANRPKLLDLYCGGGGAAMGYYRAGFDIVGVDNQPQPNYPFPFVQANALQLPLNLATFSAIHASPPCQGYSWSAKRWKEIPRTYLIEDTRALLQSTGLPFVIENVIGAPLNNPVRLCGEMFGLEVIRHRLFEINFQLPTINHKKHRGTVRDGTYVTVAGHGGDNVLGRGSRRVKQKAMQIDWMSDQELNEAIPPAYTEYIGKHLIQSIAPA